MEAVKALLKPKANPQQQLRDWQRRLHIQREEKSVQKAIKEAVKRNDMVSAKLLLVLLDTCQRVQK
ncbi:Vacuolar sorting-associated protein [Nymphaea thermarum]|nr:Vacuolar sorting-associated protein [Nymphaea thermarum]